MQVVHFDRIKPYQGPPMATWLTEPPRQATVENLLGYNPGAVRLCVRPLSYIAI